MVIPMENDLITENRRVVFSRRSFSAVVAHWALSVLAAPVFTLWENQRAWVVFWTVGFFSLVILMLATPARQFNGNAGHRPVHPKLRRLARLAAVVSIVMAALFLLGMFLLREGGPMIRDGAYVLWDHRVIREITREEYFHLCMIERGDFAAILSALSGGLLHLCCHADEIK